MRIAWFAWMAQHVDEFGYSDGPLRASIGTGAVLLTAALLWLMLHRKRPAAMAAAGLTSVLGVAWLAVH
ncbi:hypothetical protein ACPC36_09720 [Streptomyces pseudogriseolus]|uniref:hypothetical protein n=1 Tax=Streptomyces TaxID=1883 RepID=UPI0004CAF30F|nr:hypothetical protein [Streptomyces sp. NRRL F-5527]